MNLNRREFFTGSGALLAAGCTLRCKGGAESRKEWALGPKGRLRLECPGIASPLKVWVVGDTHLALHDSRDDEHADFYRRMAQYPGDGNAFRKMLAEAKQANVDLLLLAGDNISFPTLANVDFVRQALDESGIPWLYTCGNHDWHFEGDSGSGPEQRDRWIAKRLSGLYPEGADPLCHSKVVKGVRFVMIDDSDYLMTRKQVDFWRTEAAKGDPIVLTMHIPIWTEGWEKNGCLGCPEWGAAIDPYWEIERRERWPEKATPETFEFVEAVLSTPNLLAVFTGHIHTLMAARVRGQNMFSVPANRKGERLEVAICGEEPHLV